MTEKKWATAPKIVKLATNRSFFEIYDLLVPRDQETNVLDFGPRYRQLKLTMLDYQMPKVDGKSAFVWYNLHERDFLLLRNLILSRKLGKESEHKHWQKFSGAANAKYETGFQARVLKIERQATLKRAFNGGDVTDEFKILITISNGCGKKGNTGQVSPVSGGESTKIQFAMDEGVAIAMLEEVYVYLQGFHAASFKAIRDAHIMWAEYAGKSDTSDSVLASTIDDSYSEAPE